MKYNNKKRSVLMLLLTILLTVWTTGVSAQDVVYKLVTSVSELQDGDKVIIANESSGVAMGGLYNNGYNTRRRVRETVSIANHMIAETAVSAEISVFTLEATSSANVYNFHEEDGPEADSYLVDNNGYLNKSNTTSSASEITISNMNATTGYTRLTFASYNSYYRYINLQTSYWDVTNSSNSSTCQLFKKIVKEATTLSFPQSAYSVDLGQTFDAPTATLEPTVTGATITYASSRPSVATVDASTGAVTIIGLGTTQITANYAGDATHKPSSAAYTLTVTGVNAPTITPGTSTIYAETTVTIRATSGTTIYYTTDGSNPTTSSSQYTTPIKVNATTTVKAIAVNGEGKVSPVASATYTFVHSSQETYELVTDPSVLNLEDEILIVYTDGSKYYSMGEVKEDVYKEALGDYVHASRVPVDVTQYHSGTNITLWTEDDEPARFQLLKGTASGSWMFYTDTQAGSSTGYLYYGFSELGTRPDPQELFSSYYINVESNGAAHIGCAAEVWYSYISYDVTNSKFTVAHLSPDNIQVYRKRIEGQSSSIAKPVFSPVPGTYTSTQTVTLTTATEGAEIYYTTNGSNPTNSSTRYTGPITVSNTSTIKAVAYKDGMYSVISTGDYTIDSSASGYRLKFYDKTGVNVVETYEVSSADDAGDFIMKYLNNDAVKFEVEAIGSADPNALIQVELTLEPLNPYAQKTEVQASSTGYSTVSTDIELRDFEGSATLGVPAQMHQNGLNIKFDDLYNLHADETYGDPVTPTAPGNARHFYVKSTFYNTTNGTNYGTNANAVYTDKIATTWGGDEPFYFNNADKLTGLTSSSQKLYLEEYNFELNSNNKYRTSTSTTGGTYSEQTIPSGTSTKTTYVFTGDYPRYNIAPTTATEHESYAFYKINLIVNDKTYTPDVEYKNIYDKTLHASKSTSAADDTDFIGAVLTAKDENGAAVTDGSAFLTVEAVKNKLKADKGEAGLKYVLYLDAHTVTLSENEANPLEGIKELFGANALVYLNSNATSEDNFAYWDKDAMIYRATRNMIFQDKEPVFVPLRVELMQNQYAEYGREKSKATYGDIQYGSVVLPYALTLDNNKQHGDAHGTTTPLKMNNSNTIHKEQDASSVGSIYFSTLDGTSTEANVPYVIRIDNNSAAGYTFKLRQDGAILEPTPQKYAEQYYTNSSWATSTGTYEGSNKTFTPQASFSGAVIDSKTANLLYFGNNSFQSPSVLTSNTLKMYPFRGIYTYPGDGLAKGAQNIIFDIVVGENPFDEDEATGIDDLEANAAKRTSSIKTGNGYITITAFEDKAYDIINTTGMRIDHMDLQSGESRTTYVPAGIYVVDGVKVMVK